MPKNAERAANFDDLYEKYRYAEFKAPGDIQSVFLCVVHPQLSIPSRLELANLVQIVEQHGRGLPATLAWLIHQSTHAASMLSSLAQTAIDIDTILHRGLGIYFAAMCQEDYESFIVQPGGWLRTEEILGEEKAIPESVNAHFMIRMIDAEMGRLTTPEGDDFREILTIARKKLEPYAAQDEEVSKARLEKIIRRSEGVHDGC